MGVALPPGFPANYFVPGFFGYSLYGGPGTSAGLGQTRYLLVGNYLAAPLAPGGVPAYTLVAGTATANTPYLLTSSDDAALYFGLGSELHRMAKAFFRVHPTGLCYAVGVPESSGAGLVRASNVFTFATNATAGTAIFRAYIGGKRYDVSVSGTVASPVTPTDVADALCDALNADPDSPCYGQNIAGAATVYHKHQGARGNLTECWGEWLKTDGSTIVKVTAVATASGTGMTCAVTTATDLLASGTDGATAEEIATALAAVETSVNHRIALAQNTATPIAALKTWLATQAGVLVGKRQQAVVCTTVAYGSAVTLATTHNDLRTQVVWHYKSPTPAEEIAAQVLAARGIGDSATGVTPALVGEETDPAANLASLQLLDVLRQRVEADWPTATEQNNALHNGLTPLADLTGSGKVAVVRCITSRSLANGQPNYAVLDTSIVSGVDYSVDYVQSLYSTQFRGFKIVADSAAPLKIARSTSPKLVKAWVFGRLKELEGRGILRDVDDNGSQLAVAEDGTVPGRMLGDIPHEVVPGLMQLTYIARQLS